MRFVIALTMTVGFSAPALAQTATPAPNPAGCAALMKVLGARDG